MLQIKPVHLKSTLSTVVSIRFNVAISYRANTVLFSSIFRNLLLAIASVYNVCVWYSVDVVVVHISIAVHFGFRSPVLVGCFPRMGNSICMSCSWHGMALFVSTLHSNLDDNEMRIRFNVGKKGKKEHEILFANLAVNTEHHYKNWIARMHNCTRAEMLAFIP